MATSKLNSQLSLSAMLESEHWAAIAMSPSNQGSSEVYEVSSSGVKRA